MPRARVGVIVPSLIGGVIVGVVNIVKAMAIVGLIYHGPLAPSFLVGINAVLLGAGLSMLIVSALIEAPAVLGAPLLAPVVVFTLFPEALFPGAAGAATIARDPEAAGRLVAMVCGLASLVAGASFWLLGKYRLGTTARFLPYPVVAGFNAGIGWLFLLGGIGLGSDLHLGGGGWVHLADPSALLRCGVSFGIGILMLVLEARTKGHWAIMPAVLAIAVAGFHLARLALGVGLHGRAVAAWMLGPFPPGRILAVPDWHALAGLDPPRLAAITPVVLMVVLVGAISCTLLIAGIELEVKRPLDIDHGLRVAGLASAAAGLTGGLLGAPSLMSTTVALRMGRRDRLTGLVAGLVCMVPLLAGAAVLNVVPRFAVAAVLISTGLDRLVDRAWKTRRSLPWTEWAVVLVVLATIVWAGLLAGVVMGLAVSLVIFVGNYRRVSVIRLAAAGDAHRSSVIRPPAEDAVLRRDGAAIRLLRLQGYLFFLNAGMLLEALPAVGARFLILDFAAVAGMDSSAGMTLRRAMQIAAERGYAVLFTGLAPPLRSRFRRLRLPLATGGAVPAESEDAGLQHAESQVLAATGDGLPARPATFVGMFAALLGQPVPPARLAPYLTRESFPGGATLIRQGDPAETMLFIVSGRVRVELDRAGAPPLVVASAGPGVMMGEIGFYTGVARTAMVVAEVETAAEVLTRDGLARLEREDPALAALVHRLMSCMLAEKLAGSTRRQAQGGT